MRNALRILCLLLFGTAGAHAQAPVLRIDGAATGTVTGRQVDGAAAFPLRTLEALGFRVSATSAGATAVLGADTLRFWAMSPFFQSGRAVQQLAFAPRSIDGTMLLPEQFFIQWLPQAYPARFRYRNGALVAGGGSVTTVASGASAARPAPAPKRTARPPARVVVIDPGHGGRDPGKIGPGGVREKDVTLSISLRLASLLESRGYEVHLTRTGDTYVSLPDRPRMANEWKSDRPVAVFLSIHANSAPSTAAHGFETFFLSEARTDDERRVAAMENEAIRFDTNGPAAPQTGLDQILSTLRGDFLMRASHDLASVVQENLAGFHPGPNRGVKRAGFYVLVDVIMPAVLIETAFLSHPGEARLLGTQAFQDRMASGIAASVDDFFRRNEHLWEADR
jgi:N-acetylmuramoyl-L-alanine amidase